MDLKNMEMRCGLAEPSESDAEVLSNQENKLINDYENHTPVCSSEGIDVKVASENQNHALEKTSLLSIAQSIKNEISDFKFNKNRGKNKVKFIC